MSEQLTLTEESYSLSIVEDNDLQLTLSGERGPAGANGAAGAAGPNEITTATTTNLTGFISGNGTNISGATAAASAATANTLVLRDANGGASFGPLSALAGSSNQHSITSSAGTNIVGPLALSGSTGDTLTATYNAAITLNSTTGVNVNGGPLALTQTWNNVATTFTGLQVNVTDTASNAASLLMDLRVGGVSQFRVDKTGTFTGTYRIHPTGPTLFSGQAGVWSFTYFGTPRFRVDAQRGFVCTPGSGFSWSGTSNDASGASDLLLLRDAANTLAQRNGNAAQESRIYGTYTGAGADYRRLALKMSSAGVAQIVAEGGGSGSADNRLEFVTGGATRMTVAADGNITTSGSITATGVTVGSGASAATFNINELKFGSAGVVHLMAASGLVLQNSRNVSFTGTGAGMILWGANTGLSRGSAGQVLIGTGATGSFAGSLKLTDLEAVGTIKTGGYTFANLPSPATQGMRAYITDGADIPLYMANAAGGGSTVTPVFYNGSNWINA